MFLGVSLVALKNSVFSLNYKSPHRISTKAGNKLGKQITTNSEVNFNEKDNCYVNLPTQNVNLPIETKCLVPGSLRSPHRADARARKGSMHASLGGATPEPGGHTSVPECVLCTCSEGKATRLP